jgi:GT2 family glycosyltransferase
MGIQIKRSPYFRNLFAPHHLGHGLPLRCRPQKAIERVEAVTSALMIMRRELFTALGGFRQDYVRGDFEDADLCLRAAREGNAIGLVVADECYHLECQPIGRKEAESNNGVRYIDCAKFNDIWGDYLNRSPASVGAAMDQVHVGALS